MKFMKITEEQKELMKLTKEWMDKSKPIIDTLPFPKDFDQHDKINNYMLNTLIYLSETDDICLTCLTGQILTYLNEEALQDNNNTKH